MADQPEHSPDERVVVVDPSGSPHDLRASLAELPDGAARNLVIDLRAVQDLTNPDLAVLVGVRSRQRAQHGSLTLVVGPGSPAEQALARAGLWGSFTTADEIPGRADRPRAGEPGAGQPASE
jgi:hypothetical protein